MSKSPGHQQHPGHRVAERHLDQRMTVSINGEVIADSAGRDPRGRGPSPRRVSTSRDPT